MRGSFNLELRSTLVVAVKDDISVKELYIITILSLRVLRSLRSMTFLWLIIKDYVYSMLSGFMV